MQMKVMLLYTGMQVQDNVSQDVIGVIERDKIATQEATLIQLTKGMNGNSFER